MPYLASTNGQSDVKESDNFTYIYIPQLSMKVFKSTLIMPTANEEFIACLLFTGIM